MQTLYEEYESDAFTLCETPTQFGSFRKLSRHIEQFHSDFQQKEYGIQRGGVDDDVSKKIKKLNALVNALDIMYIIYKMFLCLIVSH